MPRQLREDFEGAWHHVMNRGVAKTPVFTTDADRSLFLEIVGEAAIRGALEIHGYCLMGNHFHLLVRSLKGRLADGMKWLSSRYTQRVNYLDGRDGPLFRGRYTSIAIKSDAHLVQVSRYIHLNPVEAGLVTHAAEWPWSSAGSYRDGRCGFPGLKTDVILAMFGPLQARLKYGEFLLAGVDRATAENYERLFAGQAGGERGQTRRV